MINIRIATLADAQILALLGRVTYKESHGDFIENKDSLLNYQNDAFSIAKIKAELQDPAALFYIAYVNGLPVGYSKLILGAKKKLVLSKNTCSLERIYVLNDFIPMKIGRDLLNISLDKAAELEFDTIWLSVYFKNERAINFYKKNDFEAIGFTDFILDGTNYNNILFLKKLQENLPSDKTK
ncbi:MAG: GNAT family N-acetyltransferase [Flavobacteriaceae bacterium]